MMAATRLRKLHPLLVVSHLQQSNASLNDLVPSEMGEAAIESLLV
jgi:hypothetical protein